MYRMRALLTALLLMPALAAADDTRGQLAMMLDAFLAGASAGDPAVHERFWADDLVYTSSSGMRTNKAEILARMRDAADERPATPEIIYTAADVDIRLYGDTAVVAFRLVATPSAADGGDVLNYFNTGTFLKRDGEWRAVAWQATRIPNDG